MASAIFVNFGCKRSSTAFSLAICLNNWATECASQETKDIWSNWCRCCDHDSDVTTKPLLDFLENDTIEHLIIDPPVVFIVVLLGCKALENYHSLSDSALLYSS